MEQKSYGWATVEDAERYQGPEDSVVGAIAEAISGWAIDDRPSAVFVGVVAHPKVKGSDLAETVIDRINDWLYEEVGEVADNFTAGAELEGKLSAAIETIFADVDFGCWSIVDVKRYDSDSSEYQAALAAIKAPA